MDPHRPVHHVACEASAGPVGHEQSVMGSVLDLVVLASKEILCKYPEIKSNEMPIFLPPF